MVKLVSNDGMTFTVDRDVAEKFLLLGMLLEDIESDGPISLPNVSSKNLSIALKFANDGTFDCPDPWLLKDPDYKNLFEVANVANYLNFPELMDHCCKIIAVSFKGKSPAEIHRIMK